MPTKAEKAAAAKAAKEKAAAEKAAAKEKLEKTVTLAERYEVQLDAHKFVVLPAGTKLTLNEDGKTYGNEKFGELAVSPQLIITE